ncbi:MAG: hypothetical protein ACLQVD_03205 [Capsulimonadaceae bacterium]
MAARMGVVSVAIGALVLSTQACEAAGHGGRSGGYASARPMYHAGRSSFAMRPAMGYRSFRGTGAWSRWSRPSRPYGLSANREDYALRFSRAFSGRPPVAASTGAHGYTGTGPVPYASVPDERGQHWARWRDRRLITDSSVVILGGYYYSGYCADSAGPDVYPAVYSDYGSGPQYIYDPDADALDQPDTPDYSSGYQPFTTRDSDSGPASTPEGDQGDVAPGSYQDAFVDIEHAWSTGQYSMLAGHLDDDDGKVAVLIEGRYAYSVSTPDFGKITRDALSGLKTVSFKFTTVRTAVDGDVTAFGTHIYRAEADSTAPAAPDGGAPVAANPNSNESTPDLRTMYVSYTLHNRNDHWYITEVDTSSQPLTHS